MRYGVYKTDGGFRLCNSETLMPSFRFRRVVFMNFNEAYAFAMKLNEYIEQGRLNTTIE